MKRTPELTSLSHDHHQALFVALQLKRADDRSAAAAFLEFLDDQGEHHFRLEEKILLPAWLAAAPGADAASMAERVLSEHLQMRTAAERLRADAHSLEDVQALGELLDRHVRFEERELFPRIESDLDAPALTALGARLTAAHQD